MEIDDRYWNNSSIWRNNNSAGAFSRSSRKNEDDEEDLKWAAIQRLPTYDRLRKGLIKGARGEEACEVDIKDIGYQEKKNLIDRLVKVDNEKFLLRLKDRIDRVGIDMPSVEVKFENVNVDAEVHIGSRALPSFINFCADILEGFLSNLHLVPSRKKPLSILKGVSGIIKPCRMTLLLGPPGSGKTTLLLALAGMLDTDLKFSGRISYNGHDMHEFLPQKTAAYVSQNDVHAALMTVRETLAFSARCQGVGSRYEMLEELTRREKAANIKPDPDIDIFMKAAATEGEKESVMVDYVLKILGLEACADTMIGNEMVRGVSGGQKKRITTGEILVGPANVLLMDSISTGLDSSTTFQIINSLKNYVHILNGTALISLLQPAPETYDLFDDIILLTEGHIVYEGPREHVLEFFETMGFKCPMRKGVADFLQEVVSRKDQMQYWKNKDEPYSFVTAKEFSEAFQSFHVGKRLDNEIAAPFQRLRNHPAALVTRKYGIGNKELLKACLSRELLLMKRFWIYYIVQATWIASIAVMTMTLFLRTRMHRNSVIDGLLFTSSLFITLSIFLFIGLPEVPRMIAELPLFYKHRDLLFYPAWAYALPSWILKLPMVFVEVSVWVLPMYYVIGYDPNVGRLFKQWLLVFLFRMMSAGLFRFTVAVGRNLNVSYTFGSFAMLMLFALGGFIISHDNVKKWWIWGYWASPLMYAQNAIAVNEFLGNSWKHVSSYSTEALGVEILKSLGFFTEARWYWIGIGATIGFMVIFNVFYILALAYLRPYKQHQMVMLEEETASDCDRRAPNTTLLPSQERSPETKKRGMVLPFEKHSITFDEMRYSVDMPQEMRNLGVVEDKLELLKGVSGAFRPGILTALMGVSGAGKTTLMDVLAGRKTSGYIYGDITVSGYPKKQDTFARISGYCEQDDIHSPYVTVYESLLFSAWLRLPSEIGSELRTNFIEEVMELVELTPLRNALVGLPGVDGLSTEQRKRLTIAVELVANPSIIFMDEPTTGLDARAAAIVMRTVRNIVDTGRTIVCTIHQPSIDIFEAFDELFLLTHGGREIYVGPLGQQSCHLIRYFEGIEGVRKIEDGYNPATWMLEVTSKEQEELLGLDFNDVYQQSELYRKNKAMIKELSRPDPGSKELHFPHRYSLSFLAQCKVCLLKQHWSYWRNTSYTAVRFVFTTFIALMFGSLFWDLGSKRERLRDLLNAMGSMYTAILFIGFLNAVSVHPVITTERTVFYRERAAGMYSALAYAIAQVIIELPYIFSQTLVYGAIVYAMIGFEWTAAKFSLYILFMFLTLLYFTYFGMMSVGLTPIPLLASIITCATAGLWNIFSGYLIPRPLAPVWWRWFFRVCPIAWTLYGLVASQFGDVKDELEFGVTVKDFLESYFGFRHDFVGQVAAIMSAFVLLFASLFAFGVKVFNFQKR